MEQDPYRKGFLPCIWIVLAASCKYCVRQDEINLPILICDIMQSCTVKKVDYGIKSSKDIY